MDSKTTESLFNIIRKNISANKNRCVYLRKGRDSAEFRSYKDLNDEYLVVDNLLERVPKDVCIGFYMKTEPCVPMLVYSFLGKKLCFIFLDPDEPFEKTVEMIKDLKIYGVISSNAQKKFVQFTQSLVYSTKCDSKLCFTYNPVDDTGIYRNICYIMCTSGTCGKKKYVRVTEECIKSNIICLRQKLSITLEDVIYFGTPLTFDPSIVELFLALTTGATLLTVTKDIWENPQELLKTLFLRPCGYAPVTVLQMCPSNLNRWNDEEIKTLFTKSSLRVLTLGGEPFPQHLLSFKKNPSLKIFNLYGITEVSCWASCCEVLDVVSLGEPLSDTLFEVRDKTGATIEDGCGEMYIGSTTRICLLNDEKFEELELPIFRSTGDLVHVKNKIYTYIGRTNRIIKRFGHRINLNVLEQTIQASTNLKNICVWHSKLQKISVFLIVGNCGSDKNIILDKVRVKLLNDLESKYFPDNLDLIEEIPMTSNGKANLQKLDALGTGKLSTLDTIILDLYRNLWCKYFCITMDTANERRRKTFSEMGGSSVMRLQFVSELQQSSRKILDTGFVNVILDSSYEQACTLLQVKGVDAYVQKEEFKHEESKYFKLKWRVDMLMCVDAPASVFTNNGKLCVAIGNYANLFLVLDVTSGEELYRTILPKTIENACAVLDGKGIVYVGCFDGGMYCININTKEILWKCLTKDRIKNTGCLINNNTTLVFGSYDNNLYCIELKDGSLVWKVDLCEPITSNPQCTDGWILVACIKGTIAGLTEESGNVVWKYKAKNPIFTNSELVGKRILYSDVCGYIYCIKFQTGELLWIYEPSLPSTMYSTFLVHHDMIIFGMQDKKVYILKFDHKECILSQTLDIGYQINAKPKVLQTKHHEYLLFVSVDGHILLYKFPNQDLVLVDSMILGGETFSQPVFYEDSLFIGCRDNHFYRISINLP